MSCRGAPEPNPGRVASDRVRFHGNDGKGSRKLVLGDEGFDNDAAPSPQP